MWLFGRERGVRMDAALNASRYLGSEQYRIRVPGVWPNLPEWRDVIEYPKASPVRSDNNVILMDHKITDGRRRHVEPERLPVVAVVDREVDRLFGAREKQALAYGVLSNYVDDTAVRNTVNDLFPCLAPI